MKVLKGFILLSACALLISCASGTHSAYVECLPARAFADSLSALKPVLLDVRSAEEFMGERIAGARNVDVDSDDFAKRTSDLNKHQATLVYCLGGVRSRRAAEQLRAMGFTRVYDLCGGFNAWTEAGNPVQH